MNKAKAAPRNSDFAGFALLALLSAAACVVSFLLLTTPLLRYGAMGVFVLLFIFAVYKMALSSSMKNLPPANGKPVTRVYMLNEESRIIEEWPLHGKVSLIIGRSSGRETDVDIDLTRSNYVSFVDYQHAVLNYAGGLWYLEDLYSENGVRMQKRNDPTPYRLSKKNPCRLESGDIIHIAHTRLLVL